MLSENFSTLSKLGAKKIAFLIFLHFCLCLQNIYRIDAHMEDEPRQKNWTSILITA